MPINFEQPDANAASPGALQAYLEAIRLTQHHNQGYGHGGGGGGPGFGGWGVQGLGGGGGGGHGGDGGVARDVVGEYAAMQGIDAQTREDERNRASDWLRRNTAGQQSPEEIARTQELQQRQQTSQNDPTGEDQPFGQPVEFSTADQRELDRLNQGAATIRQQLRDGFIDQATANNMNAQIHTQRNPLQIQQQAATTALTQQAVQRGNEAARLAAAHEATRIQVMAGASQQGIVNPRDPATGRDLGPHQWDDTHHRLVPMNDREQLQANRATENAHQVATAEATAYHQIEAAVNAEITHARQHPHPTTGEIRYPEWHNGPTVAGSVDREIRRRFNARQQFLGRGQGAVPQDHPQNHGSTLGQQNDGGPQPQPIAPDANRESLPAPQQEVLAHFDDFSRRIARVPGERQQEYRRQFHEAELLYHQYGSTAAMPTDIRRRVEHIVTQLNTLPTVPRRRPVVRPAADTSMYEHGGF